MNKYLGLIFMFFYHYKKPLRVKVTDIKRKYNLTNVDIQLIFKCILLCGEDYS